MKIGDKVRFLNTTGGGRVAGFQGKNIVLVEDEDGFQIPTMITDVVLIESDNYQAKHIVTSKEAESERGKSNGKSIKALMAETTEDDADDENEPIDKEITFRAPIEERKGGNQLSCYLAFVPIDIKEITNTRFECYLVNDSNYFVSYSYLSVEGNAWTLRSRGEVEPNTKEFIEEFGREDLNTLGRVAIQLIAYKREMPFALKPAVEAQFRIDPVKFYKLHTFQENDFFEQKALLYTIVENDRVARPLVVDTDRLKAEMYQNTAYDKKPSHPPIRLRKEDEGALVVDLHAHELLETTSGMSNTDILNYQLDVFRKTMQDNLKEKGKKIIFIHGKGEGVLRAALINELRYRFKPCTYQDASFQEYGFGATQVNIR